MRFQACTIIAHNYLAHARVLYRSFRKFHPDVPFSVLVFDAPPGKVEEEWDSFSLADIGLPPGEDVRMPAYYGVTDLATALKPWFFRTLLERQKLDLLYFDPDIEFFTPVSHLADLAANHTLVLTPNATRPMKLDGARPGGTDILSAGVYNLGFLGVNQGSADFLDWWGERLLREAVIAPAKMRFTEQRWMDFAPGYFDCCILKDETCNVAYWNIDGRPLTWTGERYEVRGEPLCFFHFSGFRADAPGRLSVHQGYTPRIRVSEHPALERLCQAYATKLEEAGYQEMRAIPYGFAKAGDGSDLTETMRLMYRAVVDRHAKLGSPAPPNPFNQAAEFRAWLDRTQEKEISSDERMAQTKTLIKAALGLAQRKAFVKSVKPLRRIFRNQGAVNDSLIEAMHQLALQNQDLVDELSELRGMIRKLRDGASA
ncbi:MAG: hypothetical protein ABI946_01840 [Chthoniobacterales bacterium]